MLDDHIRQVLDSVDKFSYRKYGAKGRTQSRDTTRHYFRCTVENCPGKRVVEVDNADSTKWNWEMLHEHTHDPMPCDGKRKPRAQPNSGGKAAGGKNAGKGAAAAGAAPAKEQVTKSKRASAQNVSNVVALCKADAKYEDEVATPQRRVASPTRGMPSPRGAAAQALPDSHSPRPAKRVTPPTASGNATFPSPDRRGSTPESTTHLAAPGDVEMGVVVEGADSEASGGLHQIVYPGHEGVIVDDARCSVRTWRGTDKVLGLLFDGPQDDYVDNYTWRKYGKKQIKGYGEHCPRFYWRCTYPGCDIKRHTQNTAEGLTEVYYYGGHEHGLPIKKANGRGVKRVNQDSTSPEPHATLKRQRVGDVNWASKALASPSAHGDMDSKQSEEHSDFEEISGEMNIDMPGGVESRCPLFFLACVAAKDPSV